MGRAGPYVLAAVVAAAVLFALLTGGGVPDPVSRGSRAPDFDLPSLDGGQVSLEEQRGKVVLVNFWATWCQPCEAEMPAMQKMYEEYKDQGFVVLALNMTYQDTPSAVLPFTQEYGLTFPILLETDGKVASQYELRSLPSSFFIDRDGIIQEVVIGGPMAEALLRTRIESLLK